MHRQLRELLSLLRHPEELAPGIYQASYGEGVLQFGVQVRDKAGRMVLRVVPANFLPAPVAAHPIVKTRLGRLGDILERARLIVDDVCRAVLEVEVRSQDDVKTVLAALHDDCVRLRAAASGIAAATPEAAAAAGLAGARGPGRGGRPAPRVPAGQALFEKLIEDERRDDDDSGLLRAPHEHVPGPPRREPGSGRGDRLSAADGFGLAPRGPDSEAAWRQRAGGGSASGRRGAAGGATRYGGMRSDERGAEAAAGRGGGDSARSLLGEDDSTGAWGRQTQPKLPRFQNRGARLTVIGGEAVGKTFDLDKAEAFCIGRSPHVDISIPDNVISRRNSLVQWKEDELWIEDLGSYNGTRVNGRLKARTELHAGDVIEIGWTRLRVEMLRPEGEDERTRSRTRLPGLASPDQAG